MQKKSKRIIVKTIISFVILIGISSFLLLMADIYTVPINNDVTVSQLNGGDYEFVSMRSTRYLIDNLQTFIPLLAWGIAGYIFCASLRKICKIERSIKKVDN